MFQGTLGNMLVDITPQDYQALFCMKAQKFQKIAKVLA